MAIKALVEVACLEDETAFSYLPGNLQRFPLILRLWAR
jgi:hypothetical protein